MERKETTIGRRTFLNMGTALKLRMRLRVWLILLWTAVVAAAGYWLVASAGPACPPDDFYCSVGAAAEQSIVGEFLFALIFLVWPIGIGIVWGTAEICAAIRRWYREAPERRRYHEEFNERLARALHTRESPLDANELGGSRPR